MNLELITIGTELLLGFTIDTNGAFLGRTLGEIGVRVVRRSSVADDPAALGAAVSEALDRTGFVITTGGLGPTRDDLSKQVVADLFHAPLEFHPELWERLVERFAKFGRVPSPTNRGQAEVPRGALILPNRRGTAPGLWLRGPRGQVIMLPGVPGEMRGLVTDEVVPRLAERQGGTVVRSLTLRTTSIPESTLADRLAEIEDGLAPLSLAYLPGTEGVDLRLTCWGVAPAEADRRLEEAAARIRAAAGDRYYGEGETDLAEVVVNALRQRGAKLAVAESCTGGMLGARVTEVPGSSDVFLGGFIAYHNRLKEQLLDVPPQVLEEHGAVSEPVVRIMAQAAAERLGADAAVSVSGIAGPSGGSPEKPVGTVWFGFAIDGAVDAVRVGFPGNRQEVRARAAQFALHGLMLRLR